MTVNTSCVRCSGGPKRFCACLSRCHFPLCDAAPAQSCPMGLTDTDVRNWFGEDVHRFEQWMSGQTRSICDGRAYIHNRAHNEECGHGESDDFGYGCSYTGGGHYEPTACAANPHGGITYVSDVMRFINIQNGGLDVWD